MDVHEIRARWNDLYSAEDDAQPISQQGRARARLTTRVVTQGLVFALALAVLALLVYAIALTDNVFYTGAAVVVGAGLLALMLYSVSVCCSPQDIETAKAMAASATGQEYDGRGAYEQLA